MTDFLKQELKIGDRVVYIANPKTVPILEVANVIRATRKFVWLDTGVHRLPQNTIKIERVHDS